MKPVQFLCRPFRVLERWFGHCQPLGSCYTRMGTRNSFTVARSSLPGWKDGAFHPSPFVKYATLVNGWISLCPLKGKEQGIVSWRAVPDLRGGKQKHGVLPPAGWPGSGSQTEAAPPGPAPASASAPLAPHGTPDILGKRCSKYKRTRVVSPANNLTLPFVHLY